MPCGNWCRFFQPIIRLHRNTDSTISIACNGRLRHWLVASVWHDGPTSRSGPSKAWSAVLAGNIAEGGQDFRLPPYCRRRRINKGYECIARRIWHQHDFASVGTHIIAEITALVLQPQTCEAAAGFGSGLVNLAAFPDGTMLAPDAGRFRFGFQVGNAKMFATGRASSASPRRLQSTICHPHHPVTTKPMVATAS